MIWFRRRRSRFCLGSAAIATVALVVVSCGGGSEEPETFTGIAPEDPGPIHAPQPYLAGLVLTAAVSSP